MTYIPVELVIADVISLVFLTMGAAILIKFSLSFGSEKIKNYLIRMSALIIAFAIFHEGIEVLNGVYGGMESAPILAITALISTSFLVMSLLINREMRLTTNEVKKGKGGG